MKKEGHRKLGVEQEITSNEDNKADNNLCGTIFGPYEKSKKT